jgi:hypothetical protein
MVRRATSAVRGRWFRHRVDDNNDDDVDDFDDDHDDADGSSSTIVVATPICWR